MACLLLKAIFGPGRSGTTWLGAILNAHPEVAYRFEPFHRLRDQPQIKTSRALIESPAFSDRDIEKVYRALLRAHPRTDKPPFFFKRHPAKKISKPIWLLARGVPSLQKLYERLYAPVEPVPLVFKEVSLIPLFSQLLERTSVPVVYLVRNPWATVTSELRGQEKGRMSPKRQHYLRSLLETHDPELLEKLDHNVESMDALAKTTLLWRLDVERAVTVLNTTGRGMLITYEQLCDDPIGYARKICHYFGLSFADEIQTFLNGLGNSLSGSHAELLNNDTHQTYFSVYRDPQQQRDKWKKHITLDEQKRIEGLLRDSAIVNNLAMLGGW